MELQWPLILFTTFIAWSAGVFGAQGIAELVGTGKKSQLPALVVSIALLIASGIAVFFHLQHWERIFNGFGHLSSGITQELIAIVVFALVAVVYFAMLRRSGDGSVPKWCAWCAIAISVILAAICAHSYMMPSRPIWDSALQVCSIVGASCALGPATLAVIMAIRNDTLKPFAIPLFIGTIICAVTTIAYAAFIQVSGSNYFDIGNYFDPTHPTAGMIDTESETAAQLPLLWGGAVLLGSIVPLIMAIVAYQHVNTKAWKICGTLIIVCALAGALCLRMVFYSLGYTVFLFY